MSSKKGQLVRSMPQRKGVRTSAEALARQLSRAGYNVSKFQVSSEGDYAVADADWNYKDVPHLNVVHTRVQSIVASMDDDVISAINLQQVFGIPFPVAIVNYATSETAQTYFTTLGPYILVVNTEYVALEPNRTKVTTTYHMAARGLARFAFPLLRRIVKSNYRTLMSEDIPMRTRRGKLRSRGFSFRSDGHPRTFPDTVNVLTDNVVLPERASVAIETVSRDRLEAQGDTVLIGSDDDRGVRLIRADSEIFVYPRLCRHEGANLDCSQPRKGRLSCPWHGKAIGPLMRLPVEMGATAEFESYRITLEPSGFTVTVPKGRDAVGADGPAAGSATGLGPEKAGSIVDR